MLFGRMLLFQSLNLNFRSNNLYRMRDSSGNHSAYYASYKFIDSTLLELLVHHVVQPCEEAILPAWCHDSAKERHHSLFAIDVHNSPTDTSVLVETG